MNAYLGLVDQNVVDYYLFEDAAEVSCPLGSPHCTSGRSVYSTMPFMEHELIHAYLAGLGPPPQPLLEGMAEAIGCTRGDGALTVERDWRRAVAEFPTVDGSIYQASQRFARYLLAEKGVPRTMAFYDVALFTTDPAVFALQFERWWGLPFEGVWSTALGSDPPVESLPICPCKTDPIVPGSGPQAVSHPNSGDYRPLDPGHHAFLLVFSTTGGAWVQDCERRGPLAQLLGPAVRGRNVIAIRTDDSPQFLSFVSAGTEVFDVEAPTALEANCASAPSVSVDEGALGVAAPRAAGSGWYLRLAAPRALTMTRWDGNASGLRVCRDCSLASCQSLAAALDEAAVEDGMILELTSTTTAETPGLDSAQVSFH